jgi:hypothetical protein
VLPPRGNSGDSAATLKAASVRNDTMARTLRARETEMVSVIMPAHNEAATADRSGSTTVPSVGPLSLSPVGNLTGRVIGTSSQTRASFAASLREILQRRIGSKTTPDPKMRFKARHTTSCF